MGKFVLLAHFSEIIILNGGFREEISSIKKILSRERPSQPQGKDGATSCAGISRKEKKMELKMKVFAGWMDRDSGLFIPKERGAIGDGFDTEPVYDEVSEEPLGEEGKSPQGE